MDKETIVQAVLVSLQEDLGRGDITAELIPEKKTAEATIITRESAVICGQAWVNEVYRQVDSTVNLTWLIDEGAEVCANTKLANLSGPARSLLTGERCALNWLQTLSGTATTVKQYLNALQGSQTQLLDTRKTIPGLRYAQKYAVRCGGAQNHRFGLYDRFLIKENHLSACGSIAETIQRARQLHADKLVEIEVETLDQLQQALDAQADIVMLDNFSIADIKKSVALNNGKVKLEISGNVSLDNLPELAALGVDYISIGALTKHLCATDLSMLHKL